MEEEFCIRGKLVTAKKGRYGSQAKEICWVKLIHDGDEIYLSRQDIDTLIKELQEVKAWWATPIK